MFLNNCVILYYIFIIILFKDCFSRSRKIVCEKYLLWLYKDLQINLNYDIIFRRIWEKEISDTLNNRPNKRSSYVILRSGQLVGTALVIYARADIVSNIRNVEYIMKKVRFFSLLLLLSFWYINYLNLIICYN